MSVQVIKVDVVEYALLPRAEFERLTEAAGESADQLTDRVSTRGN